MKKNMMIVQYENTMSGQTLSSGVCQVKTATGALFLGHKMSNRSITITQKRNFNHFMLALTKVQSSLSQSERALVSPREPDKKERKKSGKKEHQLWKRRDSAQSGQKAFSLVRIVVKHQKKLTEERQTKSGMSMDLHLPCALWILKWQVTELPNEKEAVYGALDKWTAWEIEFPLIAVAKALKILRQRRQWVRVIQVAKWLLSKGQGTTSGTYDTLLLAFDMDRRVDEAESLWNMILHAHTRSVSKRLFSRMISLYDHHNMPDKIIEVFADMEELQVRPDQDTVRRVARAFGKLNQEEKRKMVMKRYGLKWKYIHFKGERVKVRGEAWDGDDKSSN